MTLLDSLFLPQLMALNKSMERHIPNYTLWVLCLDDEILRILNSLSLKNLKLLNLKEYETSELVEVKKNRSKGEYCWTLTPFAPKFVFETDPNVNRVTYIDADIWFRKNPIDFFIELQKSNKQILITDHSYAPEYDQSDLCGQFCVQFMVFTRGDSDIVREWWEKKCIEWCYNRFEDGKFGDQKYLDEWPIKFEKFVHILENKELALAPWNAIRFPYGASIFYHFHDLRIINKIKLKIDRYYKIPEVVFNNVYKIYLKDISESILELDKFHFKVIPQYKTSTFTNIKTFLFSWLKKIKRINSKKSTLHFEK